MVRLALQAARSTRHRFAAKGAERVVAPVLFAVGKIVAIPMNIARDKQVQPPVAVVVSPCHTRRPVPKLHSGLLGYIRKRPIVIVSIEPVLSVVGNIDVRPTRSE